MPNSIQLLNGPFFWLVLIWVAWTGYEIGKEAKTNWFSSHLQEESRLLENEVINHSNNQAESKTEELGFMNDDSSKN